MLIFANSRHNTFLIFFVIDLNILNMISYAYLPFELCGLSSQKSAKIA